jgi:transcriptional regulator with XRE-family HTH domain
VTYVKDIRLPRGPFAEWAERRVPGHGTEAKLAKVLGMDPSYLSRILRGEYAGKLVETVPLRIVDKALCREGSTHLRELYPALYQFDDDELQEAA